MSPCSCIRSINVLLIYAHIYVVDIRSINVILIYAHIY